MGWSAHRRMLAWAICYFLDLVAFLSYFTNMDNQVVREMRKMIGAVSTRTAANAPTVGHMLQSIQMPKMM